MQSSPEVIKKISCSTQLSMKFSLPTNPKLLTISNSFLLNMAEHEIFSANKYENANNCWHFHIHWQRKFHAQSSTKSFITSGPGLDLLYLLIYSTIADDSLSNQ